MKGNKEPNDIIVILFMLFGASLLSFMAYWIVQLLTQ